MKKLYFQKVPYALYKEIKEMSTLDAELRRLNFSSVIPYKVIRYNDSLNLQRLKFLVNKYGFLNEKDYGALFNSFFYLINHCGYFDLDAYQWVKKLFLKTTSEGKCDANLYAYFVDRWEVMSTKMQYYGSFQAKIQIYDAPNINKRRTLIGLCSLENWRKLRKGKI